MDTMSMIGALCVCFLLLLPLSLKAQESEHKHEPNPEIELTPAQQLTAGIESQALALSKGKTLLMAPAEVVSNDLTTELVSVAVASQVKSRYVSLGEEVAPQQKLATLYSYEVAKAQIRYRLAEDEWQRVTLLQGEAVSDKEFLLGKAERQAAASQLREYGFSEKDIEKTRLKAPHLLGLYSVYAQIGGSILAEELTIGRRFFSGDVIAKVSNEEQVWVAARFPQNTDLTILKNASIRIKLEDKTFTAQLLQTGHSIDPITRTAIVQLVVDNPSHDLHAGMFVMSEFAVTSTKPQLLIPKDAVSQNSDGDWQVFIESKPNHFFAKEVGVNMDYGDKVAITGIRIGEKIVTQGVFFLNAQAKKSSFDVHNH
ncbi:efflux RND transporter periplasmic adaptor subunit [Pseudoalteromonas aurantia]|nr:efflux RND transporter periplasmic adaptor subunit [Pseudoalteromonas aurantia]